MAEAKRKIYLLLTLVLMNVVAFLIHALIEIAYINALVGDFQTYGLGLPWSRWLLIHDLGVALLHLAATVAGYGIGRRWWQIVYVERRHWFFRRGA